VFLSLDLGAEHGREKPGLGGANLGKALRYCLDGAVMLDQGAASRGGVCLCHVAVFRQQSNYGRHALCRRRSGELLLKPSSESSIARLQGGYCASPTFSFNHVIEQVGKGRFVAARE
jgi:hypothetical protein